MRLVPVASLLALVLATTALAAPSAAKDPSQLVLVRTDVPAGAKYNWGRMPASFKQGLAGAGITGDGAYFSVTIGAGTKYQMLDGFVATTASASQAQRLYRLMKDDLDTRNTSPLRLPRYGDEQIALLSSPKYGSKVQLLVRRNGVVWQVETKGGGLLVLPKAMLVAEIKKYAAKLQGRVGAG